MFINLNDVLIFPDKKETTVTLNVRTANGRHFSIKKLEINVSFLTTVKHTNCWQSDFDYMNGPFYLFMLKCIQTLIVKSIDEPYLETLQQIV